MPGFYRGTGAGRIFHPGTRAKLKDYASIKDWSIFNFYIDEGISGKNLTERPAVNRMIDDNKSGHVKNVLVFKLDRLIHSVADLVYLIDVFNQYGCVLTR